MKSLLLLALIFSPVLLAQPHEPFQRRPMERLESLKKIRMLEAMKLNEEDGVKLINRYTSHRQVVQGLEKERMETIDKLDTQLQSNASDAEFQKTFDELLVIERRITDERAKYLTDLKEILSPRQIAEYLVFERNFAKDIRDIMRDIRKGREKE